MKFNGYIVTGYFDCIYQFVSICVTESIIHFTDHSFILDPIYDRLDELLRRCISYE